MLIHQMHGVNQIDDDIESTPRFKQAPEEEKITFESQEKYLANL